VRAEQAGHEPGQQREHHDGNFGPAIPAPAPFVAESPTLDHGGSITAPVDHDER